MPQFLAHSWSPTYRWAFPHPTLPVGHSVCHLARALWAMWDLGGRNPAILRGHGQGAVGSPTGCAHQQVGSGAWRVSSDRKRPRLQGTRGAGPLTLSAGQPASCPVSARTCQTRLPAGQRSPETAGQLSHCRSPSLQGQKGHVRLCPLPLHTRWPQGRTFERGRPPAGRGTMGSHFLTRDDLLKPGMKQAGSNTKLITVRCPRWPTCAGSTLWAWHWPEPGSRPSSLGPHDSL